MDIHEAMSMYGDAISSFSGSKANRRYVYGYYWIKETEYEMIKSNCIKIDSVLNGLNYVLQVDDKGNIIGEYLTIREASKQTGLSTASIANCLNLNTVCSDSYYFDW